VPLDGGAKNSSKLPATVKKIRDITQRRVPSGLEIKVTGSAGTDADFANAFAGIDTTLLLVTFAVVALILLITYRSPLLWLIPLISVGVASQLANGVIYLLATHAGLLVNGQSAFVLTILVFGVGTDYALLLIARYREELRRHADRHLAMSEALHRSRSTILASATTVALALLCLLAAEMNNTRGLGPVAAVGIMAAFLAMTTLLPALLVILGRWLFWPFVPHYDAAAYVDTVQDHGPWSRVARAVGRRPRPVWMATALVLGVLALGITTLSTGVTEQDLFTHKVDSVIGQELLAQHFPAGSSAPEDVYARDSIEQQVMAAIKTTRGVARAQALQRSAGWVHIGVVLTLWWVGLPPARSIPIMRSPTTMKWSCRSYWSSCSPCWWCCSGRWLRLCCSWPVRRSRSWRPSACRRCSFK
jgi:RND superfamily putative drug exporter